MRPFLPTLMIPAMWLAACAAPQPPAAVQSTAAPAPFEVPMDPGAISCASLSNPTALVAATDWVMGRARAAVLAGTADALPTADTVATNLANYCSANGSDRLRTAAAQLGL